MSELSFLAIIGGTIAYLDNYKRALVKVSLPTFFLLLLIDLSSLLELTDTLLFTSVLSTLATGVTVAALSTAFKMITTLQAPKGE